MLPEERHRPSIPDEPPPFLGEWRKVYLGILCYLVVLITLFAIFGRSFTPAVAP